MEHKNDTWDANLYDRKMSYVADYGKDIVDVLKRQAGEKIVDLGCGTGDLTNSISKSGADTLGIDAALWMLQAAAEKYPHLSFQHADARHFKVETYEDAVFSNAALHWIKFPQPVISSVYQSLKTGGRFVAEMGGKGNVQILIQGMSEVLQKDYGLHETEIRKRIPWYFPSIAEYTALLEEVGFRVTFAQHFDRPTVLPDGEDGLNHWLASFSGDFFPEFSSEEKEDIYEKVKEQVRHALFKENKWEADYKRLRIVAFKEGNNHT